MQSGSHVSFKLNQRVHLAANPRQTGTVKYVGPVQGHSGRWIGVDWDGGEGKHDGSINGVRYFTARLHHCGSFVRPHNLSSGISFVEAVRSRYQGVSTKEEDDEMYVLSQSNKRVSVQLVGKDKIQEKLNRLEELETASLSYMGIVSPGSSIEIKMIVPNIKELDLSGNLLSEWRDVATICKQLSNLESLNLSANLMQRDVSCLRQLRSISTLVLNNTMISWPMVEEMRPFFPSMEVLYLMGNNISATMPFSSSSVGEFDSLRLINLENNQIDDWNEIMKLSLLPRLEQLHLNRNNLKHIFYPDTDTAAHSCDRISVPFKNLSCLLLGSNGIDNLTSIDSLNLFPNLKDIRLSDNPVTDSESGGVPRFVLVARLAKVETLNGSKVTTRERRDSEIRYVRMVMLKLYSNLDEVECHHHHHPRFAELKAFYGIENERTSFASSVPQKMASGLLPVAITCVSPSAGEGIPITKKLPATTTVGKLKILCAAFFKINSTKLRLFLHEQESPVPVLLDDDMATLADLAINSQSAIVVDEET